MRPQALDVLRAPGGAALTIGRVDDERYGEIKEGVLASGSRTFPIHDDIPRFVDGADYVASFGEQWNRHRQTQLDKFNGTTLSHERFYSGTGWRPEDLAGTRVLEAGCGAGRFTEVLLEAGADVFAFDFSRAVDACWRNHGPHPRLTVVQADLFDMPFLEESFDRVFCYGVLQHTPDVRRAFRSLLPMLKRGGLIAVDVYLRLPWTNRWTSKYWYRGITKRLPPDWLRRFVEWYVPRWLPIDTWCGRSSVLRRLVPALVPCWNYSGMLRLPPHLITEWAVLDTFDALASRFDYPQSVRGMRALFEQAGLADIYVRAGGNGILGNARKP